MDRLCAIPIVTYHSLYMVTLRDKSCTLKHCKLPRSKVWTEDIDEWTNNVIYFPQAVTCDLYCLHMGEFCGMKINSTSFIVEPQSTKASSNSTVTFSRKDCSLGPNTPTTPPCHLLVFMSLEAPLTPERFSHSQVYRKKGCTNHRRLK